MGSGDILGILSVLENTVTKKNLLEKKGYWKIKFSTHTTHTDINRHISHPVCNLKDKPALKKFLHEYKTWNTVIAYNFL